MPVKVFYLTQQGELQRNLSEDAIRTSFQLKQGVLWVDIGDITAEDGKFLERVFHFHHLAV